MTHWTKYPNRESFDSIKNQFSDYLQQLNDTYNEIESIEELLEVNPKNTDLLAKYKNLSVKLSNLELVRQDILQQKYIILNYNF